MINWDNKEISTMTFFLRGMLCAHVTHELLTARDKNIHICLYIIG